MEPLETLQPREAYPPEAKTGNTAAFSGAKNRPGGDLAAVG